MKYLFGPVFSRRLGLSLGVDLVPFKVCSMDCLYCEVGRTTTKTLQRKEYVPTQDVKEEIYQVLSMSPPLDHVTFSGAGEPTLHSKIGEIANFLKEKFPSYKVALLTNSTLLYAVASELKSVDVFLPSLDTATDETLKKLNRPAQGVTVSKIVDGILKVKELKKRVLLETLFVKGINDDENEVRELSKLIHLIKPDTWQINTVVRPPAYGVQGLTYSELQRIAQLVGYEKTEIVSYGAKRERKEERKNVKWQILSVITRRPSPLEEICESTALDADVVLSILDELISLGEVEEVGYRGKIFYRRRRV